MIKLYFILLFTSVFLFAGCEYEPGGNNFVALTPPEENILIEISLNDINPSDTIYVYQNTSISININTSKDLLQAVVFLDEKEYAEIRDNSLSFNINPDQFSEGVHKLTVNAILSSGTGSLAEIMGMEGYMGELSWNICIIHDIQNYFHLGYRSNEEGFLEIFWETPIPDKIIERYTVHSSKTLNADITITDAAQKSFVDYGYVCGSVYYQVRIYLKNGYTILKLLSLDKPVPALYFDDLGIDSLRVSWDKPFANGRFILTEGNITIASGMTDTTIIIPQLFGAYRQFSLETRPQKPEAYNTSNKFTAWGKFHQGTSLGLPNWPLYAYNITDNIIYTTKYNNLVALDASTLQVINTVSMVGHPWGLLYGGKVATAPHNSTVAAMTGEETWIFSDSRFNNPVKIPLLPGDIKTRLAALTSNDRFFVVQNGSDTCKVFNALTGEKIFKFPFTYKTKYDIPTFVTVSDDGQFFCASSENGIEVFQISGTATTLLYTDTRQYKGAIFVPSEPDKLLLRTGSNMEIHQLPDFSVIQTFATGARMCNVDPSNKSLLYYLNDTLRVCKTENLSKTIFRIRTNQTYCTFFNNLLLTGGGISFDITPYLEH